VAQPIRSGNENNPEPEVEQKPETAEEADLRATCQLSDSDKNLVRRQLGSTF
jgi:hypothetical protein